MGHAAIHAVAIQVIHVMNEDKLERLTDDSGFCDSSQCQEREAEMQAEIDALTIAQNAKCADCNLVKQLSAKNATLMSKLNTCSSERSRYLEINQEAADKIKGMLAERNRLINNADQEHIKNVKREKQLKDKIADLSGEIGQLQTAMEENWLHRMWWNAEMPLVFCRLKNRPVAWKTDCKHCDKVYSKSYTPEYTGPACDFTMLISYATESDVNE